MAKGFDDRTKLLIGEDNLKILKKKRVAICGNGGVGSIIPLALARSGIYKFMLVDFDKVDKSNLNRQIAYCASDIGKDKIDALSDKIGEIRLNTQCDLIFDKIDMNFDFMLFDMCDYVFDCIDDIEAKALLIAYCKKKNIKIISSLGMGNRLDPTKVTITKLNKTTLDPLARKLRYILKKYDVDLSTVMVSFSSEKPIIKDKVVSSMVFVPNAAGLAMASYALRDMLNIKEEE